MSFVSGKYELESQEHFEKFLIALGAPPAQAKVMNESKTVVQVTLEGTKFTIVFEAKPHRPEVKNTINLGQETEIVNASGKQMFNISQNGNTLQGTITAGTKIMKSCYTFSETGFVDIISFGDVTATRRYKRI